MLKSCERKPLRRYGAGIWSLQQPIVAYKSESQLTTPFKKSDYD